MIKYLLPLLILVGCSDPKDEFEGQSPRVNYKVEYEYVDDLNKRYEEIWDMQTEAVIKKETLQRRNKIGSNIKRKDIRDGFSYDIGDKCVVVLSTKPYALKELERTLGHEHLHCKYGAFHNE